MEFIIFGQICFDALILAALWVWWSERKHISTVIDEDRINRCLESLDQRSSLFEKEELRYRSRMDEGFKLLSHVCEQAKVILQRGKTQNGPPTLEEDELKAALLSETRLENAASDKEADKESAKNKEKEKDRSATNAPEARDATKAPFRPEISLDLRSLLRDQLT